MEQSDLDILETASMDHLQSVLKTRHMPLPSRQSSVGAAPPSSSSPTLEIAQLLFEDGPLREVLSSLDEVERAVLRELVACGGRANSRDLTLYLTNTGLSTPAKKAEPSATHSSFLDSVQESELSATLQYPIAHPHGVLEMALRRLLLLGLVFWGKQTQFASRDYTSGIHDGVLIVPLAVKKVVRSVWNMDNPPLTPASIDIGEKARSLQRSLYLYWSLAASMRDGLALLNNRLLSRAALRSVMEHMGLKYQSEQVRGENDVPRLLFIRLLLMKLGLLQERHHALHATSALPFFSLPPVERARRCYRLWLETSFWNDLLYLPEVSLRPGPAPLDPAHEEAIRARQTVVERLLHEQTEVWHQLATFITRTKLYAPYLLFPRQYGTRVDRYTGTSNVYGWDFRLRRGWLTHREGWYMVEGGFIRALLAGPLHWLGIVEIDREENPITFRISSAAVAITSDTPPMPEEISWGRLIVQPNFELVALAPVSEALLITLDRFAERVGLEHIAQYRITKASVTRAIQWGLHAEDIQKVLEDVAGGEIPQNVQYSLVEWERQARRVEMWPHATLLEVDDATLLDALFANAETHSLLGRRLTSQIAEIAPHHLTTLQEILWGKDFLPSVVVAPSQETVLDNQRFVVREAQWRLHDDGLLQPFYAVVDLYLAAEAKRFSEPDEATGWRRITPSSLRRAQETAMSLDYIVRFLQQYCEGGVPTSLLIRLKLWGGGYGEQPEIAIEPAPLLHLSAQVLQDLQNDEELKPLLGSEIEQQSRLVRVDAKNLEQVVNLLKERGFVVE
jgi:XPB/Ssl2-like helicase family protein